MDEPFFNIMYCASVNGKTLLLTGSTSTLTAVTIPNLVTAGGYVIAGGMGTISVNESLAMGSGTNVLLETVFDGDVQAYETATMCIEMFGMMYMECGAANAALGMYDSEEPGGNQGKKGVYLEGESGKYSVVYGTDDIAKYQYNMIENPGPLAEMPNQPAKNFYGGRYNMEVLQEDRIMYRAGNAENPYGRWFTSEPPASVANVRIDTAVKTHWIDPKTGACEASSYIDNVYAIKVPKGTTVYTGPVGPQGGAYVGGYNVMQTYIDAPWTFEVVGKTPLH